MVTVNMPDGTPVRFPDDMPKTQIAGMIAAKFPDAANKEKSTLSQARNWAGSLVEGAGIGVGKMALGALQLKEELASPDGYDNPVSGVLKQGGSYLENKSRANKTSNPVAGTIGELAPQIGSVAGLGVKLPALALGSAGLAAITPKTNEADLNPYNGTSFERTLQPVGDVTSAAIKSIGIDPESRFGMGLQGGAMGAAAYGVGKGLSKGIRAANRGGKALTRGLTRIDQDAITALQQSGIDPTLQLTTNSPAIRGVSETMQKLPLIGNRLEAQATSAINKLDSNVDTSANRLGTAFDPIEGGQAIQQGLGKFIQQTGDMIDRNYNTADTFLPPETPANMGNTKQFSQDYLNKYSDAPKIGEAITDPRLRTLSKGVQASQNPSYKTLKNLRTDVGEQAGKIDAPGAYKQMYGALSKDMQATAQGVSPEAAQAASRANNYYRAVTRRSEKLKTFFKQEPDGTYVMPPERAANASRQDLALLKKTIPKEEFNNYTSSVVRKMGEAPAGAQNATGDVFSPNTFLTNYTKLSKSGKAGVLFDQQTATELNRAAKVADRFRQLGKAGNKSNTTNNATQLGAFAAFFYKPVATVAFGGPAYGFERLLTSPKALKVINDYAYRPVTKNPTLRGEFSAKLLQAAGQDIDLQNEIKNYLQTMEGETP